MNYSKMDFIPGDVKVPKSEVPAGFEFWDENWKLEQGIEEVFINGQKVIRKYKRVIKPDKVMDINKDKNFYCNSCEFKTLDEPKMKEHVEKHNEELKAKEAELKAKEEKLLKEESLAKSEKSKSKKSGKVEKTK